VGALATTGVKEPDNPGFAARLLRAMERSVAGTLAPSGRLSGVASWNARSESCPKTSTVILLVGLEGMSYERAAALRLPVGTIRSHLSRGRDALRKLMNMEHKRPSSAAEHHLEPTPLAA